MPICIFCPNEEDPLSEEHVFPAALGGVLVVESCVCTRCNNGFSKFEQPLIREMAPLRFILQIPNRYGKIPYAEATAKTETKEYDARVLGDGKIQLKPIVTKIVKPDGKKEYLHQFLTERQRERLEKEAKEKGWQFVQEGPGEPEQAEIHIGGELEAIGSPEGLRTVAKIAFMGVAFRAGVNFVRGDTFGELRNYIAKGTGAVPVRQFVHQGFVDAVQQGPHQDSIIIAARHDRKRVDAIVRLFGGLCYFVEMSNHYEGADYVNTVVFDAHRGEENGILQAHPLAEMLQTEDVLNSPATVWGDLERSGRVFVDYLEAAIRAKRKRDRDGAASN